MKKIGIFLGIESTAGGMFQYAESILDALQVMQNNGDQVYVAYAYPAWENILAKYDFHNIQLQHAKLGLNIANVFMALRIPGSLTRFLSKYLNPILWQISKLNCDFWIFPSQDALSYQISKPVIATIHDLMHRYESSFPEVSSLSRRAIRDHRYSHLANWAKAILVDSQIGREHVFESYNININKIFSLPYIAPSHVRQFHESESLDKKYDLPKKYIFYPAQFWPHKNHKRLIEALSNLKEILPDIKLVFTGGKIREYSNLVQYAKDLNVLERIVFAGYVPDQEMFYFYKNARALMMPTFFGPTNIPPLEAFVCGCPAAVSKIYGMPEQLGNAALFFDPLSVQEITETMKELWTNDTLCRQLIQNGYDKNEQWGPKQFTDRLIEIINTAALK